MDALMIRSFGTSPNVISKLSSGSSSSSYAFFTVVRGLAGLALRWTSILGRSKTGPWDTNKQI
jgi:hypothetical protein